MKHDPTVFVVGPPGPERQSLAESLAATRLAYLEFDTVEEFLSATSESHRGCVIANLRLFGIAGLDLQVQLKRCRSTLPLILVSNELSTRLIVRVMQEGAQTVLESPVEKEDLYFAVRKSLKENERRVEAAAQRAALQLKFSAISQGEQQVLEHMCEGLSNREIAEKLSIHVRTVEARKHRLLKKAGCKTVPNLLLSYQLYCGINPSDHEKSHPINQDAKIPNPYLRLDSPFMGVQDAKGITGPVETANWSEPSQ